MGLTLLWACVVAGHKGPHKAGSTPSYDACVVGAGGSGAFAAVKLKQKGLKVLVLETSDYVGGQCTSDTFSDGSWIDPGVAYFLNETIVTDTFTEFNVTALPSSVKAAVFDPTITQAIYTPATATWAPVPLPDPAFVPVLQASAAAWIEYWTTVWAPYIETPNDAMPDYSKVPKAIAQQLAGPFGPVLQNATAWVLANKNVSLDPILPVFVLNVNTGPGSIFTIPAIIALRTLHPRILRLSLGQGIVAKGGCASIYRAFHKYLGSGVVKLSAKYKLTRGKAGCRPGKRNACPAATVQGTYSDKAGVVKELSGSCKKVVISAIPSIANLKGIYAGGAKALDKAELKVFSQITHNTFSWAKIRLRAPGRIIAYASNPTYPAMTTFTTERFPNGKGPNATGLGVAYSVNLTPNDTFATVKARIYSSLKLWATNTTGGPQFTVPALKDLLWSKRPLGLHQHTPRPSNAANTPAFYVAMNKLQGHRGIYYTGALMSFNSQASVWKYSKWLADTYFSK